MIKLVQLFSKSKIPGCFDFHFLALVVAPGHHQGDVAVLDKSTPQELAPVANLRQSCENKNSSIHISSSICVCSYCLGSAGKWEHLLFGFYDFLQN